MEDQIPMFSSCPRCGERGLDILKTHSFCVLCDFSPDLAPGADDCAVPQWALEAIKNRPLTKWDKTPGRRLAKTEDATEGEMELAI